MSLKRKQPEQDTEVTADVYRSAPIEDRSSTFIGLYSPTLKPKDLQNLAEIASASHKILAWRKESNQQSITKAKQYVTGSDDDGEKYGGKKVEKVLSLLHVSGSCVVARWYGGVMLGPVRFEHMENAAKEAIEEWRRQDSEAKAKKRKLEEDEAQHARLSKSLVERDQSITVLRELATQKEIKVKEAKEGGDGAEQTPVPASQAEAPSSSAKATIDYSAMSLDRLKALDKGRDATISFLLKRIDKAEAELASLQETSKKPP